MSDISNVSGTARDVTFKIYKINVDDLLVESVSDLTALFSIGYHQYTARESDQSLQKLVKSSTKNSFSHDLCLEEYVKYRNDIGFPEDNSLIGIRSLMKTIEFDFETISYSRQNDDNFYALGPIHFVICCILKGCNAIVTSDMINYLLDIIVNQNHSFNLPNKLEDIGEYCNINNLSAINSLISLDHGKSSSSMMTFDFKFLRDPNEDQNNLIALLKRISEIRETDTSNLSLMIKLNSIEKIVKDLINVNESVVVQYNSRLLDEEYCHTLKGPLIASLVSIVNSNGFDPEKEVDIQCFPTKHKNNNTILDSIIRFKLDRSDFSRFGSNENLVRANRYSQGYLCFDKISDLANASTITNMKKILSLFKMIDSHSQLIV